MIRQIVRFGQLQSREGIWVGIEDTNGKKEGKYKRNRERSGRKAAAGKENDQVLLKTEKTQPTGTV